jgi:methenyltetrahydrofolate cyclohydrolase
MAARFSRDDWPEAGTTVAQAEALRRRAVELAGEVSDALEGFLAAQQMGDPRPEARDFRLGRTLDRAADVPLAIAAAGSDVAALAAEVVAKGDGDVRADAASAALIAHGAACAAAHLVEINLVSLPDDDRVKRARGFVKAAGEAAAQAVRTA